jgi:hypothetical protein
MIVIVQVLSGTLIQKKESIVTSPSNAFEVHPEVVFVGPSKVVK